MKTQIEVHIQPFLVPNSVYEIAPMPMPPSILSSANSMRPPIELSLSDLSAEALEALCDEFRESVFKRAGKSQLSRDYVMQRRNTM